MACSEKDVFNGIKLTSCWGGRDTQPRENSLAGRRRRNKGPGLAEFHWWAATSKQYDWCRGGKVHPEEGMWVSALLKRRAELPPGTTTQRDFPRRCEKIVFGLVLFPIGRC